MLSLYSHFSKNATLNARIMIIYCVNPVTGLDNAEQLNIIPIIGNNDYVQIGLMREQSCGIGKARASGNIPGAALPYGRL